MATGDLVLTPEGLLAYVEAVGEEMRVKYANTETCGIYPKTASLVVVARRADLEKALAHRAPAAAKEG